MPLSTRAPNGASGAGCWVQNAFLAVARARDQCRGLLAGCTQAGKTTLLNCLAAAIPGGERVVSVEEVFELRFPHPE